jgi:hypothetical protein
MYSSRWKLLSLWSSANRRRMGPRRSPPRLSFGGKPAACPNVTRMTSLPSCSSSDDQGVLEDVLGLLGLVTRSPRVPKQTSPEIFSSRVCASRQKFGFASAHYLDRTAAHQHRAPAYVRDHGIRFCSCLARCHSVCSHALQCELQCSSMFLTRCICRRRGERLAVEPGTGGR